ncbi:MAG: energy-coupling factor transporter transmembrane component T [Syntrophorhabdales bacterium]|jgi:energy-coupling factor transporter transmembrane protein EcfT
MKDRIPPFLERLYEPLPETGHIRTGPPVLDRALKKVGSVLGATFAQWDSASKRGLLQSMDERAKLVCLLFLLVVATLKNAIVPHLVLAGLLLLLVCLSRLNPARFYRRIVVLAFLFGFLIVLPAACNVVTGGTVVLPLLRFREAHPFWIYTLPDTIGITREGLSVTSLVTLRMVNCLSVCFLLLHTTSLPRIVSSLKVFRVPDRLLIVLVLSFKYIFIFSRVLESIYLARKSRSLGRMPGSDAGNWAAGRIAFLFRKTQIECEEVFQAMLSRGLAKEIELASSGPLKRRDVAAGICLLSFGGILLWL